MANRVGPEVWVGQSSRAAQIGRAGAPPYPDMARGNAAKGVIWPRRFSARFAMLLRGGQALLPPQN